ncbi:MAG: protease complex subunit PrcB family protein, partial [Anaerolineae bacterium]|nr:protease complex subunit PrcB family protein [Anaerolineae bacterium]
VEVTDVQRKDNIITIYAQFHEPAPDALTNPLITSPYYILKVEKTESIKGEFTFVLVADGIEVARQEHVIP